MGLLSSDKNDSKVQETERVAADAAAAIADEKAKTGKKRAQSYWAVSWNIFKKNKLGMFCLIVVALLCLVAIFAPVLAPYDPDAQEITNMFQNPGGAHIFGTDEYGRDILSRVIYGCRISLSVGVVSQAIALLIGFTAGVLAGYFGGKVDAVISFVIQVFSSFPFLLFAIVVMFAMGPGLINLYVALGLLGWTSTARLVRGDVMRLKGSEYIQSCILSGGKPMRIILKHLLPNCIGQIVATTCLQIPSAIFTESFMSFLGVGVLAPLTSLGSMCSDALGGISTYPYRLIIPAIIISIMILSFNLFGDGLRDALDPRLKK